MDETGARRRSHRVSHLVRHAHGKPDRVCLRFEGSPVTRAQLAGRVHAVAAALRRPRCALCGRDTGWAPSTVPIAASPRHPVRPSRCPASPPSTRSRRWALIGGTTVLFRGGGFGSTATLDLLEAERVTCVFPVPAQ